MLFRSTQTKVLTYENGSEAAVHDILMEAKGKILSWAVSGLGMMPSPNESEESKIRLGKINDAKEEIILIDEVKFLYMIDERYRNVME